MNIEITIKENVCKAIETLYDKKVEPKQVQIKQIPKHLEGDYSVITFPFAKLIGKKPNEIAADLATQLMAQSKVIANAMSAGPGFCNLSIGDAYWTDFVKEVLTVNSYGQHPSKDETVLVEYSSPNTNKPLHLGHIRNNLLGYATAEILKAAGYDVKKVQIINDRGVHICKSMLAWEKWGNGETPESTGKKGDHLVGHYYVEFEKHFQVEYKEWQGTVTADSLYKEWVVNKKNTGKVQKKLAENLLKNYFFSKNDNFYNYVEKHTRNPKREKFLEYIKEHGPYSKTNGFLEYIKEARENSNGNEFSKVVKEARENSNRNEFLKRVKEDNENFKESKLSKYNKDSIAAKVFIFLEYMENLKDYAFDKGKDFSEINEIHLSLRKGYKSWKGKANANKIYKKWYKEVGKNLLKNNDFPVIEKSVTNYWFRKYFFKNVYKNKYFNEYSIIGRETKEMLQKWEANDADVKALWNKMNGWVYEGFKETYETLGVDFDKLYYESQTYLSGKQLVLDELESDKSIFFKKDDGSTWIDLTDAKLDEKVVLRSDGTSMYITQDLGTAALRFQDFKMNKMVYVVGNEQDYHFKVLFETLKRLGHSFADNCHHLSYGMVNLTTGRMKSREGTVVDADHLMADVIANVKAESESREKLAELTADEKIKIWEAVALGALKFYILKVEPKKSMTFDPKQSIDLQGQTGPYIQNAHVRTQSVQRMVVEKGIDLVSYEHYELSEVERDILVLVHELPSTIEKAAQNYNPADIANYLYDLAKEFHKFWGNTTILDAENQAATSFRLDMSKAVAVALKAAGKLIGMHMPDRM